MPGPLLAVDIAETPRHGWQAGLILSIGHAIAEIAVVVGLSFYFATLSENTFVVGIIGVAGGLALIIMGGSMAHDILRGRVDYSICDTQKSSNHRLAVKGITATLSNPYWFVWWGTTGLAFIIKSLKFGVAGPVVFYFGHILSDFVWFSAVAVLVWRGKSLLAGRGLKILILCCAIFLVFLGAMFITDGLGLSQQ